MRTEQKIAMIVALLLLIGVAVAALLLEPAAEIWTRGQQLRVLLGAGLAGAVLVLLVPGAERRIPEHRIGDWPPPDELSRPG
jgi:hypothetical protein